MELGAGDGADFTFYPSHVTEVFAIEPEPRLRAQATEAASRARITVRMEPGTADARALADESVDAVVASLVLCTVPDQAAALAEAWRVMRPGGELRFYEHVQASRQPLKGILATGGRSGLWPVIGAGCHPARQTLEAIQTAGFTVERCERFGFGPSTIVPRLPHIRGIARRS